MRIDDTSITLLSHRAGRIARNVAIGGAVWLVSGTVLLVYLGVAGTLLVLSVLSSFGAMLIGSIVALAHRGGPSAGTLRSGRRGSIAIDDRVTIVVDGRELRAARAVSGFREELGPFHQVILELPTDRAVCVRVRSAEEGDALLDAAGVGVRQRTLTLRIGAVHSGIVRTAGALLIVLSLLVAVPSGLLFCVSLDSVARPGQQLVLETALALLLVSSIVFLFSWNALRARIVSIGRDGLLVRNGIWSQRFFSFRGLAVVRRDARIELRSQADRMQLKTSSPEEAEAIAQRIEAARTQIERDRSERTVVLSRSGRSMSEWRNELRALLDAPHDYRSPVDAHDLAEIVEDPASPAEQRIAAAVALSSVSGAARQRVDIAIATTAEPKLRVALERASEGELDPYVEELLRR
jgi:hypothetical protein